MYFVHFTHISVARQCTESSYVKSHESMIWCLLFTKQFIEVWFGFCCEWEVNVVVVDSCQFRIKWRVELTWLAHKSSSTPALYPRMPRSTNQISISFSGRWAASQDMIGQLCSFFLNWPITRVLIHSSPSSQNLYLIVTCCLYQLTGRWLLGTTQLVQLVGWLSYVLDVLSKRSSLL